jgi:tetraacyldisaccharide 4'-kinase
MLYYLKLLLWPFSLLYGEIMSVRNLLYNKGVLPSRKFDLPIIAVGNLTVGGTGKTPHVEYLLRLLTNYNLATLSRGYKRRSKGFVLADSAATVASLGDEPYQYYKDFDKVTVAVCEDRVEGVKQLLALQKDLDVIILDDAMQHRSIQPSLNLLITDFNRPFYRDLVMPAGLLREPANGAARADAIIVSKCPVALPDATRKQIVKRINKHASLKTPVFFTTYKYGAPVRIGGTLPFSLNIILLTGIANDAPLKEYLIRQGCNVFKHFKFPDHYEFTGHDMLQVEDALQTLPGDNIIVVTTRKDAVKLLDNSLIDQVQRMPVFYIPVEVSFLDKKDKFDQLIHRHVDQFSVETPTEPELPI